MPTEMSRKLMGMLPVKKLKHQCTTHHSDGDNFEANVAARVDAMPIHG